MENQPTNPQDTEQETTEIEPTSHEPGDTIQPNEVTASPDTPLTAAVVPPTPDNSEKHPKHHLSKKQVVVFSVLAIVLILTASVGAFLLGKKSSDQSSANTQPDASAKLIPKDESKAQTRLTLTDGDIVYHSDAKPLGNLKLMKAYVADEYGYGDDAGDPNEGVEYFEIGTTKDGHDVIYISFGGGLGPSGEYIAISDKDSYTVLTRALDDDNQAFKWADNVTIDNTTKISALVAPDTAEVSGQKIKKRDFMSGPSGTVITPDSKLATLQKTEIGTSDGWKFYRAISTDESSYQIISIYATFNNIFWSNYNLNGELAQNTDKQIAIKWSKGENNSSTYDNAGVGCGNSGFMVPRSLTKNQLAEVGKSPQGQTLYQLPATHAFVKDLHEKDYSNGEYLGDTSGLKNLTAEQLNEKHGYFLVENALGDYVVMLRGDIFIRGGCAKPVVYLYPTKTTNVSVSVGADVTLSDPYYNNSTGWRNVIAQPNGQLTYQAKQYGSLFWEGYGHGEYPAITAGTVVRTEYALHTMRQQLYAQGMNQTETNEFIDFWKDKLPSKPYTRITWFDTKELNQLAPLYIVPRPQTLIRVFVDFEGLEKPIYLPPQQFQAPARNGFTVTEWGGLARDGSVPKLLR